MIIDAHVHILTQRRLDVLSIWFAITMPVNIQSGIEEILMGKCSIIDQFTGEGQYAHTEFASKELLNANRKERIEKN